MIWMFLVTADGQPRSHARILQVFDNQRIAIQSLVFSANVDWITVHVSVEIDDEQVNRVGARLLSLESVLRVDSFAIADSLCRTVALFKVCCDLTTQLSVLQAAAALGLLVVDVDRDSVLVEAVGSSREITNYEGVLVRHGALTIVARATLGVIRVESPIPLTSAETWRIGTGLLKEGSG